MSGNEKVTVLACERCELALVGPDDVIVERFSAVKADAVFAYQLDDICGLDGVWSYSATNPTSNRFDVVRIKPVAVVRGTIKCTGSSPSTEHTWFPPYGWNMATCARCGSGIGWGFYGAVECAAPTEEAAAAESATDSDTSSDDNSARSSWASGPCNAPEFVGLIVTACVARDAPRDQPFLSQAELEQIAVDRAWYAAQRTRAFQLLRRCRNQLAANTLALAIRSLDRFPERWRDAMPSVMDQVTQLQEETDT